MAILSCKNLNVQYDNQVALKNVNFDLEDGDYLCIIGDNGSGKSTLMNRRLFNGIFPLRCTKSCYRGASINGDGARSIRKKKNSVL